MQLFINRLVLRIAAIISIVLMLSGCKKFVTVATPYTAISQENIYASDATAIGVLTSIYSDLSYSSPFSGAGGFSEFGGLSSDELTLWSGVSAANLQAYYKNLLAVTINQSFGAESWSPMYFYIYRSNAAIEGIINSGTLTPAVKTQLLGEAQFLRAILYFYLTNFYGDVPLAISTDYKANAVLARSSMPLVYQQIIADLKEAQKNLSAEFLDGTLLTSTNERVRPTLWAATALLAKTYLYAQKWDSAKVEATSLINNGGLFSLDPLNDVFLKNSTEAIWQLQPVVAGYNTLDAQFLIIPSTGPSDVNGTSGTPVYISKELLNAFEPTDQRRLSWVDSVTTDSTYYFPYKYKNNLLNSDLTEYLMILRLGEQYLIRAEAEAELSDLTNAANDLNIIRNRAGLPPVVPVSQSQMLAAISHERQVEMFTELGSRWLDLKRTGAVDSVMTAVCPLKGTTWHSYQQLYPLLFNDILQNHNLVQNPGY